MATEEMKVMLINPGGGYPHEYPPLGLLYIASSLRNAGYDVHFYDEGAETKLPPLIEYLKTVQPDICGFSLYTTNVINSFNLIRDVKKHFKKCRIVVGGPHATAVPQRTLKECPEIDYLVLGEGELAIVELLKALVGRKSVADIEGLCFRNNSRTICTPPRKFIKNLDTIDFPTYDLIKKFRYRYDPLEIGEKVGTLIASRGCPFKCNFCNKAVFGSTYRRRSPENVIQEMEFLCRDFKIDEFYFMDDLFAFNSKWIQKFCQLLRERNIRLPWRCLERAGALSKQDYMMMKENGCYVIQLGVESGNQKILDSIGKCITIDEIRNTFSTAREAGLDIFGYFIFGHRDDNRKTIKETLNFAIDLKCDFISFFTLVPFPGTKVNSFVNKKDRYNWARMQYLNWNRKISPISICSVSSDDLARYEEQAYMEYFGRFGYLFNNIIFHRDKLILKKIKMQFWIRNFKLLTELEGSEGRIFYPGIKSSIFYFKVAGLKLARFVKKIHRIISLWIRCIELFIKVSAYFLFPSGYPLDERQSFYDEKCFVNIWKDYLKNEHRLKQSIQEHIGERGPFIEILLKYVKKFDGRPAVLEAGCGTALDSYCLRKETEVECWSIDISTEAIEVAKKIGSIFQCNIKLGVSDVLNMCFADESFDLVFSQGLVEHFQDPAAALREQKRILKYGGYLIVDVPQKYNPYTVYKHEKLQKNRWHYGWEREFTLSELKNLGEKLGLETVKIKGRGYGFNEDFGFSKIRFFHKKFKKNSFLKTILDRIWQFLERHWGHYFMQSITIIYKK